MSAIRTVRDRARAELTREIKNEARRQLAIEGANALSLRAVARELGMVSSALYRYFRNRDELLTALIVDAYNALGEIAESAFAAVADTDVRGRWREVYRAVRAWARRHPHEYALIYGSPIPGYRAPQDTVTPASRVPLVLIGVLRDSWAAGTLRAGSGWPPPSTTLSAQIERLATSVAPELPGQVLARAVIVWTQLFGMLSFELFGQLVGSVDPSDDFFEHAIEQMADFVGLPADDAGDAGR
ncbi:MAG: TetR family transcriptional regulator [Pseudonocardiaceae bacterium]|nr:TetR family transcriptional regulator [Pseudonocardiaceae bacterium]